MKLTSKPLSLFILVFIFGGILFTTAMNWWRTESTKQPNRIVKGEAAGEYNPADIRGSYTFGDIERAFNVPAAVLADAFGVISLSDPAVFTLSRLESMYSNLADQGTEIGTSSVRYFVALYTGLPLELTEETYLPQRAVDILLEKGDLSMEDLVYMQTHVVELPASVDVVLPSQPVQAATAAPSVPAAPAVDHEETDREIKGKTTFAEVISWGVSQEAIEAALGMPMPNPLTVIRDFCDQEGLGFGAVKEALQVEIEKVNP